MSSKNKLKMNITTIGYLRKLAFQFAKMTSIR